MEMDTWISLLPLELDGITPGQLIEPDASLLPGDKEVGVMPETARRLHTLSKIMERDSGMKLLDARVTNDQEARLALESKAFELGTKCKLTHDLMWIGIRDELKLWHHVDVGIRRGFKVVVMRPPTNPFLKVLGGEME